MNKTLIILFVVLIVDITARNQKNQMLYQTAVARRRYFRRVRMRLANFRHTCSYVIRCYFSICWRQRVCTH